MATDSGINTCKGLVTSPAISAGMVGWGHSLAQGHGICFGEQMRCFLQQFVVLSTLGITVPQLIHPSWEA